MSIGKTQCTKNYSLFFRSNDNRALTPEKHKRLLASMKRYGFLEAFPIIVWRDAHGRLIIKDGQHRLAFAESLGLPVYWKETDVDFDIALINNAAQPWVVADYAHKFAQQGNQHYQEAIDYSNRFGFPIATAFSLLSGTTSFKNFTTVFRDGLFQIKDRAWADSVAAIYVPITAMQPTLKGRRFLEACMAVCRVETFDHQKMVHAAEQCRDKLVAYTTRDAYLDMLEEIYNFRKAKLLALKNEAIMAMRNRSAAQTKPLRE